eukprot:CAMPEP_0183798200 /NCGR_PEP_ID=MMETSP0803_2-20130417/18207_1 /TAXON_ID=195967 /ORGANISM="Crustomastix stigmata, Strain CCMP3273" /LENGTH=266 /DNA_ID=CAMNT_0026042877 /DNA_START=31 /DNA_END=831 /DNA_ORIENTATION=+
MAPSHNGVRMPTATAEELVSGPPARPKDEPRKLRAMYGSGSEVEAFRAKVETEPYKIQFGDTAFMLAREYGTSVAGLVALNPGLRPNNLAAGEELRVPTTTSRARLGGELVLLPKRGGGSPAKAPKVLLKEAKARGAKPAAAGGAIRAASVPPHVVAAAVGVVLLASTPDRRAGRWLGGRARALGRALKSLGAMAIAPFRREERGARDEKEHRVSFDNDSAYATPVKGVPVPTEVSLTPVRGGKVKVNIATRLDGAAGAHGAVARA